MTTSPQTTISGPTAASPQRDAAMLVHDVRNALQGVLGGVSMLDGAELAPANRAQLDRVSAAASHLNRLLGTLLGDFAQTNRPGGATTIDVARFMCRIAKRWSGEADERGIRFEIEVDPDAPTSLRADLTLLARAIDNLVDNAMCHAGSGESRLRLLRAADGGLIFEVLDDGPGIPQQTLDKMFRPSARPGVVNGNGHGLGLYIARSFCAEMGGAFTLSLRPAGGTRAALSFPASLCGATFAAASTPQRAKTVDLAGVRILLAEDNPTNQIVATQMLRALKAEVTLSSDGVEAMEIFEAGDFDLIVVDIEMPRMTGLDVIRAIRGRKDGRGRIPIVALTAYAMREHRDRIAAAGANGLISKPITSVEALGQALRVHVAPSRRFEPELAEDGGPWSNEPVADIGVFDALCNAIGGDMMAELLEKVVTDLMQARRDLAAALSPLDRKAIRSASHILISVAGAIGATRLQSCSRALNTAAQSENARNLPDDTRRCLAEIDAAVAFAVSRRPQA